MTNHQRQPGDVGHFNGDLPTPLALVELERWPECLHRARGFDVEDELLVSRYRDDPEMQAVFNAIRQAQEDATTAVKQIEVHQAECRGMYAAINTKIDAAKEKMVAEMWWLRTLVIALIAIEVLGVKGALSAAMKQFGLM